ncbi:MAG: peptidoglycan-associated lipoprotein [Acidobacteria bacterium RIFCSPLOWO2_12_FULL_67_14]|nr:MAG: peptidoglycan-associated lipoprotein [Acidobacteria bacterium RIFCSPLOWO2_02_FULL_67_21]OFW36655.1 MAG: peptidoglycan-associated lipoprotein [Acidobacteria bacterium RIFCSPLOWO2_12_FULL_67_14]
MVKRLLLLILIASIWTAAGCARRQPPVAGPAAPPPGPPPAAAPAPPPRPAERVEEALPVPAEPLAEDEIARRTLDELNRDSPFKPVFFGLDSAELDEAGRSIVTANAGLLKKYPAWVITIEGHCDERGTAEYNLALGERRAAAVRTYLVSLGLAPDRIRIVSYGKEFPFDPGHTDAAWAKNRRAHFVITSK